MAEDTEYQRGSDPLGVVRSRWLLCLFLAVLGGLAGAAVTSQHTTQTTAEARLAVGSQDLNAFQVGSYAEASEKLAANYARYVQDSPSSTPALQHALGDAVTSLTSIVASPIPDSNVLRIEVTATNRRAAVTAAQTLADELRDEANVETGPLPEDLLTRHEELAAKMASQQAKVERRKAALVDAGPHGVQQAAAELNQAQAHLSNLQLQVTVVGLAYQQTQISEDQVETKLAEIQPATVTGDDRRRTLELYTISGLLIGLAVGAVLANLLGRKRRRRSRRGSIAGSDESPTEPGPPATLVSTVQAND